MYIVGLTPKELILSFLIIASIITTTSIRLVGAEGIEPFINLGQEYTDNLFLEKENIQDDYITTLEGGVKLSQSKGTRKVEAEYKKKLIYHKNYSEEDRKEHNGNIKAAFGFGRRYTFSVKVKDRVFYEKKDSQEPEEPKNFTQLSITNIAPSLRLLFGRGGLDIGYEYLGRRYEDPDLTDTYDWKGFLLFGQKITHRISGILGWSYLNRHNKGEKGNVAADYEERKEDIGLKLEMPFDMKGQIKYSFIQRTYEEAAQSDYSTLDSSIERTVGRICAGFFYSIGTYEETGEYLYQDENEYHRWAGKLKITLRKRHVIKMGYGKGFYQNLYETMYERKNSTIEISHEFGRRIKLVYGGYDREDTYEGEEREESTRGGKASLEMFFSESFSLLLSGDYEKKLYDLYEYKTGSRQDKYLKSGAKFTYHPIDLFSLSVHYTYQENQSNYPEDEYTNNKYAVTIKAHF